MKIEITMKSFNKKNKTKDTQLAYAKEDVNGIFIAKNWKKNWKPKMHEPFYFVDFDNDIEKRWYNSENDMIFILNNRIFKTHELARKWLEIDNYLKAFSFEPNWFNDEQDKWIIFYDVVNDVFDIYNTRINYTNQYYYDRRVIVSNMFLGISKNELKFYFDIPIKKLGGLENKIKNWR